MEAEKTMKILCVNTGSSSIKCSLFEMPHSRLLMKGEIERIGQSSSLVSFGFGQTRRVLERDIYDYHQGIELFLNLLLTEEETRVLTSTGEIEAIGHRVVHGGSEFSKAALIDDEMMSLIKRYAEFAPLHGFANIAAIESCQQLLPENDNIAVFDTALYQTIPPKAYLYGLPIEIYEKHGIRRYGFHGINHRYVAKEASRLIGKQLEELRIITCHLGSGASVTAFRSGRAVDTSMGFTPLEGLIMGTRCGDIDPGALIYIVRHLKLDASGLEEMLDKYSGLKGLCGKNDIRDVIILAEKGDEMAGNALEVFVYRVQKYIGAYMAALGGIDAVVFTGGIGENSSVIRKKILDAFGYLNIKVNEEKNQSSALIFSTEDSSFYAMTIPANEELEIARETFELVGRS
jgi:acetate kinase